MQCCLLVRSLWINLCCIFYICPILIGALNLPPDMLLMNQDTDFRLKHEERYVYQNNFSLVRKIPFVYQNGMPILHSFAKALRIVRLYSNFFSTLHCYTKVDFRILISNAYRTAPQSFLMIRADVKTHIFYES